MKKMTQCLSWQRWLILLMLLWAAFGLRLYRLDYQDIWWDEARNIDVATRPLMEIATAPELDIHPPLYFYTLHAWTRLAGASAFATRFLSVWFGMLAIALVYQLARRLGATRGVDAGSLALAVAAFAPYGLAEAQETRMYTMSWALLAGGMLSLWWAMADQGRSWRRWLLFGVLVGLALVTHYSTVFILTAWGIWLVVWAFADARAMRARWLRLLMVAGIAILIVAPIIPIAWRQIPGYNNPNLSLPSLGAYLAQLYRAFTLGEFVPPKAWMVGKWLWSGWIVLGALLWLWPSITKRSSLMRSFVSRLPARPAMNRGDGTNWIAWSLLVVWLVGGLAVFYAILIARSAFNPRYISFVLPALWGLTGWALLGLRRWARPIPWLALGTILIFFAPSLQADLFDPAYFREDMTSVVNYLQNHATPADMILVDQRYPFGFYWQRWNNEFYGMPPDAPADGAPAQYLFVDIDRIDERLSQLAGHAQRVFYVTWYESDMDPRGAVPALLDAYGQRIDEQHYRGYTIQVWQLHPPTTFRLPRDFAVLHIAFEPGIVLEAGDWRGSVQPIQAEGKVLVALRWRVNRPTERPYKVSVRLKDASGATIAQDDRVLLSNRHLRTTAWAAAEEAVNVYLLSAPAVPGDYNLSVVLYDEETLEATGVQGENVIEPVIGSVHVVP